jgi:nucleotide-binding universal stress UspA family protein
MHAEAQIQETSSTQAVSSEGHLGQVLVPIDFSSSTAGVLRYANELAEQFGAAIELLHIIPRTVKRARGDLRMDLVCTMGEAARQELMKLVEVLWPDEIKASVVIKEGDPPEAILEAARASHAQLVILPTPGNGGLSGWRYRRSVNQLVSRAPCPVVLVPEKSLASAERTW